MSRRRNRHRDAYFRRVRVFNWGGGLGLPNAFTGLPEDYYFLVKDDQNLWYLFVPEDPNEVRVTLMDFLSHSSSIQQNGDWTHPFESFREAFKATVELRGLFRFAPILVQHDADDVSSKTTIGETNAEHVQAILTYS